MISLVYPVNIAIRSMPQANWEVNIGSGNGLVLDLVPVRHQDISYHYDDAGRSVLAKNVPKQWVTTIDTSYLVN